MFPGILTSVPTQPFFSKLPIFFYSCIRGERRKSTERKIATKEYRTRNLKVMSQIRYLLGFPDGLVASAIPFPNKPWLLRVCSICLLETLWEKEKLLVLSNFSYSHSVFYPLRELSAIFNKFEIVVCKLF